MAENSIRSKQAFGIISQNIMRNPYITRTAKQMYAYLASFAGASNTAFPSRDLVCHEMNINKDTFTKYMWELQCWKITEIERTRGAKGLFTRNLYIVDHYPEYVMMDRKDFEINIWPVLEEQINSKIKKKDKTPDVSASKPCPKLPDMVAPYPVRPDTKNNSIKNNIIKNNNTPLRGCCCCEDVKNINKNDDSSRFQENDTSGSKLSQKTIKRIMREYDVTLPKKTLDVLSDYTEADLHKIGSTLCKKRSEGKILNPSGILATKPEEVCRAILCGQFYPSRPSQHKPMQKQWQSESEFYIAPDEIEALKSQPQN